MATGLMYNTGPPAEFKACIDNIVRVGCTFGFDRSRRGSPYWPFLAEHGKRLVVLSSRGDYGYSEGECIHHLNHVEPSARTAFRYLGIIDFASITCADAEVDALVERLLATVPLPEAA
jgi:FMN-dependent NADH-azoreductase